MTDREHGIDYVHYAERLTQAQAVREGSLILHSDPPPTRNQIAAVLRGLADHTLLMHLNSEDVLRFGDDRAHLGPGWRASTAQGRYLQRMADALETWDDDELASEFRG